MTVAVMDGQSQVTSTTAVNNQQNGTYEADFNLDLGTNIQGTGSVVVTCSAMNGQVTNGGLTIAHQTILTINSLQQGAPKQVAGGPRPAGGGGPGGGGRGQVVGYAGKSLYLRLTDAGSDIIKPAHRQTIGNGTAWECNLSQLVANAGRSASRSRHYNIHVSVWDNGERVRVSSGFFSVGM